MNNIRLKRHLNEWFLLSIASFLLTIVLLFFADFVLRNVSFKINYTVDNILVFVFIFFGLSPATFSVGTILFGVLGYSRQAIRVVSFDTIKLFVAIFVVSFYAYLIVIKVSNIESEVVTERKRLTIEEIEQETTGTVRHMNSEGGFWGIVGDNGENYDTGNLPVEFKVDGLRVRFKARVVPDVGSFHMWGSIVRIEKIQKLE